MVLAIKYNTIHYMSYKYKHSVLGGTFDHFHKGHERFIGAALADSEKLTIGITSDEMLDNKSQKNTVENYPTREQSVEDFITTNGHKNRVEVFKINDIYGPSIDDLSLEAIYVIDDTYKGAEMVNLKRESLGLTKLAIVVVPTLDMNDSKRISSTAIRLGKIDRHGNNYADLFPIDASLTLPDSLRDQLKEPFGEVVNNLEISKLKNYFLIAVGDIVVSNLLQHDVIPNLSIFDKISNREKITEIEVLDHLPKNSLKLNNAPGTINCTTALKIEKVIQESIGSHEKFSIEISGEEDLLALPAMLFAPLDSRVIYGLKDEGAVVVTITEDLKKILVIQIIKKLKPLVG